MTDANSSVRILHTSDWQLGMARWFLGEEAGPRYQEARLSVVEKILDVAVEHSCAAVVVAGDVFDDNLVDDRTWRRTVDILTSSPVPVFLLPGNHDPYDPASIYRDPIFDSLFPTVQVLTDSTPRIVPRSVTSAPHQPEIEIIGAPLLAKYMSSDPVAATLRDLRRGENSEQSGTLASSRRTASSPRVRVLVGHGATYSRTSATDPSIIDLEVAAQACRDEIVDYIALGDTHSATKLHDDGTIWYSGSPEPTDFQEENGSGEGRSGRALIVDLTLTSADAPHAVDVSVEEVQVGQWHFLALSESVDSREDVLGWLRRLDELPGKRTTVVKYALTGTIDLAVGAFLDQEMAKRVPSFAALYPRERLMDLHIVPGDSELLDAHWPGAVGEAAQELAARTVAGDDIARDSLRLLYRLSSDVSGEGSR